MSNSQPYILSLIFSILYIAMIFAPPIAAEHRYIEINNPDIKLPGNPRVADAENPADQAESAIKRFFRIPSDCDLLAHHVRIVKPIAIPSFMFLKTDKPIQSILQSLPAKQRVYSIINISGLIQFFVLRIFGKPKPLISAAENLL